MLLSVSLIWECNREAKGLSDIQRGELCFAGAYSVTRMLPVYASK